MSNKDSDLFEQTLSKEYRKRIMQSVQPELDNLKTNASPFGLTKWMIVTSAVIAIVVVSANFFYKENSSMLENAQELANFGNEDFEVIQNLELIDDLDLLEELDELDKKEVI